jgi:hypothetical protein
LRDEDKSHIAHAGKSSRGKILIKGSKYRYIKRRQFCIIYKEAQKQTDFRTCSICEVPHRRTLKDDRAKGREQRVKLKGKEQRRRAKSKAERQRAAPESKE